MTHEESSDAPFALIRAEQGRLLLAAVDAAAAAAGLVPGLPLADARAILPGLRTAEAEPEADLRALARLAEWCGRYTPWVALDRAAGDPGGGGGLLLDVTGCAHLFGGEGALTTDLLARVERLGYAARAALAETPGAAWALAR
ncbi:MAG: DNA polymerase Y family protein, partial [Kiloniellales bacterium]